MNTGFTIHHNLPFRSSMICSTLRSLPSQQLYETQCTTLYKDTRNGSSWAVKYSTCHKDEPLSVDLREMHRLLQLNQPQMTDRTCGAFFYVRDTYLDVSTSSKLLKYDNCVIKNHHRAFLSAPPNRYSRAFTRSQRTHFSVYKHVVHLHRSKDHDHLRQTGADASPAHLHDNSNGSVIFSGHSEHTATLIQCFDNNNSSSCIFDRGVA